LLFFPHYVSTVANRLNTTAVGGSHPQPSLSSPAPSVPWHPPSASVRWLYAGESLYHQGPERLLGHILTIRLGMYGRVYKSKRPKP
jgi:hypothetical protein